MIFHAIGTPSVTDLIAIIWMNLVRKNPVTLSDVRLVEKRFGPDNGTMKEK